jgi:type II secretory pathway pseudopilin PulG
LIIVIIIVGVLSSLALPRFYNVIEYSRSVEALQNIAIIRSSLERCGLWTGSYDECYLNTAGKTDNLDIEDPGNAGGAHFQYRVWQMGSPQLFRVRATRNALDGGNVGEFVQILYYTDGSNKKTGSGVFLSIK